MRMPACLALVVCLVLAPALSVADELPDSSKATDEQADTTSTQPDVGVPAVTTRTLDPPTLVAPVSENTPPAAPEEAVIPLEFPSAPPQQLPPGPPNRLP